MRTIKINTTEFTRLESKSSYNHNYYHSSTSGDILLEEYVESNDTYLFYIILEGKKVYLGESHSGFEDLMLLPIYISDNVSLDGGFISVKVGS